MRAGQLTLPWLLSHSKSLLPAFNHDKLVGLSALVIMKDRFSQASCPHHSKGVFFMTTFSVFVGIDVSKDKFDVCAISNPNSIIFESAFDMSQQGFSSFANKLSSFPKQSIVIAMESTGCYHLNLLAFLSFNDFACVVFNPLTVKNFASQKLKPTKSMLALSLLLCFTYNINFLLPLLLTLSFAMLSEHVKILSTASQKLKTISKNFLVFYPLNLKEFLTSTATLF